MIRVLVDSAADYLKEELAEKHIEMAPLTITIGEEKNMKDEVELSRKDLYKYLIEGKYTLKTSQPSPQEFLEIFEDVKEKGDEMVCILLSSTLSGTYQSAVLAKQLTDYDGIYIIDSLSATVGIKIMADHALKMIEQGYNASEIADKMEALKSHIKIIAVVDTLKYLYLGGRVSKTTAIVADTVNIKPGIIVSREGAVEVTNKYLGVARGVKDLVKQRKNVQIDTDYPLYLIFSHDDTNVRKLEKALTDDGISVDGIHELGATLGVHVGPGAFGVICMEK